MMWPAIDLDFEQSKRTTKRLLSEAPTRDGVRFEAVPRPHRATVRGRAKEVGQRERGARAIGHRRERHVKQGGVKGRRGARAVRHRRPGLREGRGRGMRALGDLPSQVKLVIYQLIAFEDRSKAELVFPSFKEIAQQL